MVDSIRCFFKLVRQQLVGSLAHRQGYLVRRLAYYVMRTLEQVQFGQVRGRNDRTRSAMG